MDADRVTNLYPQSPSSCERVQLEGTESQSPRTRIILLTHRATEARILEGLSLGAQGYLERRALAPLLPKAVRAVDAGEAWVPRRMVDKVRDRLVHLIHSGVG